MRWVCVNWLFAVTMRQHDPRLHCPHKSNAVCGCALCWESPVGGSELLRPLRYSATRSAAFGSDVVVMVTRGGRFESRDPTLRTPKSYIRTGRPPWSWSWCSAVGSSTQRASCVRGGCRLGCVCAEGVYGGRGVLCPLRVVRVLPRSPGPLSSSWRYPSPPNIEDFISLVAGAEQHRVRSGRRSAP